jgi:S-(hydroxymethyl)glutathione dehydrogenase/alcohol dehydrogenase
MKAAVLYELKTPLKVEDVDLDNPKRGEVRVKIVANGVCHSDYSVIHGVLRSPLPVVPGHEGAGIVEEVGPDVTLVKPGDHVVLSFAPYCGHCYYCSIGRPVLCDNMRMTMGKGTLLDGTSRLKKNGKPLYHMAGLSSFAQYAVVAEISCIKIADNVPLDKACLVGCGVMTGVGAAINTAKVEPGSSAVVIGCGGVGLNVIQGCALAGAGTIIAVDLMDNKLEYAKQFGATHTVNPSKQELNKTVRSLTEGRGSDYAFEVIGLGKTIEQAYACTRQGGTTIVVGAPSREDTVTIPASSLLVEKCIKGSLYGSARPRVDMPMLIDLYMNKKLKIDELVSRTYSLDEVNVALAALEKGEVARSVVVM